jgi:hypothetical protein
VEVSSLVTAELLAGTGVGAGAGADAGRREKGAKEERAPIYSCDWPAAAVCAAIIAVEMILHGNKIPKLIYVLLV